MLDPKLLSFIGIIPNPAIKYIKDDDQALEVVNNLNKHHVSAILLNDTSYVQTIHNKDFNVGVCNIVSLDDAKKAIEYGANFLVLSTCDTQILDYCIKNDVLALPTVNNPTEIKNMLDFGIKYMYVMPDICGITPKGLDKYLDIFKEARFFVNDINFLSVPNVCGVFTNNNEIIENTEQTIKNMLGFELIHLGINQNNSDEALNTAQTLCNLFGFKYYKKPKSHFAGRGFEILNSISRGTHGHIGIYTPYPEKAMYYLKKKGVKFIDETITRNKRSHLVNFVYLDLEIAGFGVHLINPDVKM